MRHREAKANSLGNSGHIAQMLDSDQKVGLFPLAAAQPLEMSKTEDREEGEKEEIQGEFRK